MHIIRYFIIGYFIVINLAAFIMYGADKRKAIRNKWRISEASLMIVAVIGGGIGAFLGMRIFHHKIRKPAFAIGVPAILIVEIMMAIWVWVRLH